MKKLITTIFIMAAFCVYAQDAEISGTITLVDLQRAAEQIKAKEQELIKKEQELAALEERLSTLEKDLVARENDLKSMRTEISAMMDKLDAKNEDELASLAKMYSSTKPKAAASIFIKMDLDKSAEIMKRINAMNAGKIMAEIAKQDADYASRLSTVLAGGEVAEPGVYIIKP